MNYFNILQKENVENAELAKAYSGIETTKAGMTVERETAYKELLSLQQENMSGKAVASKVKASRESVFDLDSKIDACTNGLEQIRGRMISQSPDEIKSAIAAVDQIFDAVRDSEKKIRLEMIQTAAKTAMFNDILNGEQMSMGRSGPVIIKYPDLNFTTAHLSADEKVFYQECCDKNRVQGDGYTVRKNRLSTEIEKFNTILKSGDFPAYVEKQIKAVI